MKEKIKIVLKRNIGTVSIISIGLAFVILFISLLPTLWSIIPLLLSALFLFLGIKDLLKYLKSHFCLKCLTEFNFDNDMEYDETNRKLVNYRYDERKKINPDHQVEYKLVYSLDMACYCPKCGNVYKYKDNFEAGTIYYDGSAEFEVPELAVKNRYNNANFKQGKTIFQLFVFAIVVLLGSIFCFTIPKKDIVIDPKDYYGTYYSQTDYYDEYLTIDENHITVYYSNVGVDYKSTHYYYYTYDSLRNVLIDKKDTDNLDTASGYALKIIDGNELYTYYISKNETGEYTISTNKVDKDTDDLVSVSYKKTGMHDYKDSYPDNISGMYLYNTLYYNVSNSGTLVTNVSGKDVEYEYIYVPKEYMISKRATIDENEYADYYIIYYKQGTSENGWSYVQVKNGNLIGAFNVYGNTVFYTFEK